MAQGDRSDNLHPRISIERLNGVARIHLSGEFDLASRERLERALAATEANGSQAIYIDLTEVSFMDSTSLRVLLEVRERANQAERELLVRGARGEVWRLFQIAGVDVMFQDADHANFPPEFDQAEGWVSVGFEDDIGG